jgi:hypothetical protein
MYADHFNLKRVIKFNRKVVSLIPLMENGEHSGRWQVTVQKLSKSVEQQNAHRKPASDTKNILDEDQSTSCSDHHVKKYVFDHVNLV